LRGSSTRTRRRDARWGAQRIGLDPRGALRDHPEVADLLPRIDTIVLARVERGAHEMDIARRLRPILDRGR
jgi:hypothetical protein